MKKLKNTYAMKVLAGGAFAKDIEKAYEYAFNLKICDLIAVGMVSEQELDFTLKLFNEVEKISDSTIITDEAIKQIIDSINIKIEKKEKSLRVMPFCIACKKCIDICPNNAISLPENAKIVEVDKSKCILCGYCAASCPEIALRMA